MKLFTFFKKSLMHIPFWVKNCSIDTNGGKLKSKKYLFFFLLTFKKELELRCSTQYKSETKGSYHNTLLISNIILHQVLRNKSSAWTKRIGNKILSRNKKRKGWNKRTGTSHTWSNGQSLKYILILGSFLTCQPNYPNPILPQQGCPCEA